MERRHETFLRVKQAVSSDGERWITAWASTPDEDLAGDVVDPAGAQYDLPIPLLAYHRTDSPVGVVTEAHVSARGIRVRAKLSRGVALADELWALVKDGAVAAVSIGFKALKSKPLPSGGLLFEAWRWLELSLTPVPMNANARIISVGKSIAYATQPVTRQPITPQMAEAKAHELGGDEWAVKDAGARAARELLPPELRQLVDPDQTGRDPATRDYSLRDCAGRNVATVKGTGEVIRPGQPATPKAPQGLTRAQAAQVHRMLEDVVQGVGTAIGRKVGEVTGRVERLESSALHDGGFFAEGKEYRKGAVTMHDGQAWLATADTEATPGRGAQGWRLLARKTRDA